MPLAVELGELLPVADDPVDVDAVPVEDVVLFEELPTRAESCESWV